MLPRFRVFLFAGLCVSAGYMLAQCGFARLLANEPAHRADVVLPASDKFEQLSAYDLSARAVGETAFTDKTKKYAVEVKRDNRLMNYFYLSETGTIAVAPSPKNYELRQLTLDHGGRYLVRFSPYNGLTWLQNGLNWEPVEETGQPPVGDYEIYLMAGKNGSFFAARIDHITGRTWNLANGKWEDFVEGKAPEQAAGQK